MHTIRQILFLVIYIYHSPHMECRQLAAMLGQYIVKGEINVEKPYNTGTYLIQQSGNIIPLSNYHGEGNILYSGH